MTTDLLKTDVYRLSKEYMRHHKAGRTLESDECIVEMYLRMQAFFKEVPTNTRTKRRSK